MLYLFIIMALTSIAIQDFKSRSIRFWWLIYPVAAISAFFLAKNELPTTSLLSGAVFNILFIVMQLLVLTVYFSFKHRKLVSIFDRFLGWGDVLLFIVFCFLFSPVNFILFYMLSTFLSLCLALCWLQKIDKRIPLAGLQASMYLIVLAINWVIPSFSCYNDQWLLTVF